MVMVVVVGGKRGRGVPSDDGKIFGYRANFHSTVNTRRAEAEKLVRTTKINLYTAERRARSLARSLAIRNYVISVAAIARSADYPRSCPEKRVEKS